MGSQYQYRSLVANNRRGCEILFLVILLLMIGIITMKWNRPTLDSRPTFNVWGARLGIFDYEDDETAGCNFEDYIFGHPIDQMDPCLVAMVKKNMLIPPPLPEELNQDVFNITNEMSGNIEKFKWIKKLLVEKDNPPLGTPGFFIECGANDGLFISSTLNIEKTLKWTGLLIEANPTDFEKLVSRKRNVWAINAAACITPHPEQIQFYVNPNETGISGLNELKKKGVTQKINVQCIPLYTMLAALNVFTVDFLNLDVEGVELAVLKTIPFDKVMFKVLTIEYAHIPGKQKALKEFLEPKGYRFVKEIKDRLTVDCLYVHESLYELAKSIKI